MTGARGLAAWALALAACGDNAPLPEALIAISGERLAVQWYGFDDGTRQAEPDEFYDRALHTRCAPAPWTDDVVRCVPVADDAVYTDAACSQAVGRALTIDEPEVFVGYDRIGDELRPTRVYRAGDETDPIAGFFQRQNGDCRGPFATEPGATYFALAGEVPGGELVALHDGEWGGGRLGLGMRETDDGLRMPLGLRDRTLDAACTPRAIADGSAVCAPDAAAVATHFADPDCRQPVVVLAGDDAPVPVAAIVLDGAGCPTYHALGGPVAPPLYRRDGDTCVAAPILPVPRVLAVGAPLALPALARSREVVPGRRLQPIVLDDGDLRVHDQLLYDTAIRAECRRQQVGEVVRCLPAEVAPATALFTAGCAATIDVVELPARACTRPGFATSIGADGLALHAIGDPAAAPLFRFDFGQCLPYSAPPGTVVHLVGPALHPTAFVGAVYYGER